MKLNRLFLLAAMGLGLFACNDNNDLVEGSAPNGTQEEGTTYVGLKINFNSSSSRANTGDQPIDGDGDDTLYDDPEDGNEAKVSDVRIVVTDAEGKSQFNDVVEIEDGLYIFQITPGIKKFYAVVNGKALGFSTELANWTGDQLTLTKKASELYEYNATATKGKGFLMSSVAAVEQTIQNNVSKEDVIAGKANNVEITVERAVAKVTMKLSTALTGEGGFKNQTATLKKLTCQIGNADNLKYNKDGVDDAKYTTAGTYLMAYNDNGVRKTPYFAYPEINTEVFWTGFEQTKLLNASGIAIYEKSAVSTSTSTARFYCLENTHANGDGAKNYLQSNTTFIRVKAEMIPNSAKQFAYSDSKVTISVKQTMPTNPETFYVITAAPNQDDQGSYVFASDLASLYTDLVPDGGADNNDKAAEVVKKLATYGYNFTEPYTDGCGYYNIWVNDMKGTDGQYLNIAPIFRNDWYDLTITSLTLPGSPNESLDPEQPIHPNTNVGITLTVRDWNKVNHNVNLQ